MSGESTQRDQALNLFDRSSEEPNTPEESLDQTGTMDERGGQDSEDIVIRPSEGARNFSNPLLKDKSPEEIERLFQAQQDLIRQQNTELNTRLSSGTREERAPAPEEPAGYGDHFLAPDLAKMEDRLSRRLSAMVEPLREQAVTSRTASVREQLRKGYKYFEVLEPTIDQILRQQGADPSAATEQQLVLLYHTAVGMATERGVPLSSAPAPTPREEPSPREQPVTDIPQRRPSSAPLPADRGAPKLRQLSENERRLAREYRMTDEEYIKEMDRPDDEVVTPGFSKDRW